MAAGLLALGLAVPSCRSGQPATSPQSGGDGDDPEADAAMVEGRWEDALRLHRDVLDGDPDNAITMYHTGYSEGALGRRREEVGWYERALKAGFRSPDLLYNLGLARLGLDDLRGAESALAEAMDAAPDEAEFQYAAARVSLAQGRDAQAKARLELATELDPDHDEAWAALASLHERRGDSEAAATARSRTR